MEKKTTYNIYSNKINLINFIIISIVIITIFIKDTSIVFPYYIPKIYAIIIGACLLLAISTFYLIREKNSIIKIYTIDIIIYISFIYTLLTIQKNNQYLENKIFLELSLIIIFIILSKTNNMNASNSSNNIFAFFILIFFLGIFQSVFGIGQFILFKILNIDNAADIIHGSFGPQNAYGSFIGLSLIGGIYILEERKEFLKKPIFIISLFMCFLSFILCQSRGAWFSFILVMIPLGILHFLNNGFGIKIFKFCKSIINIKILLLIGLIIFSILIILFSIFVFKMDMGSTLGRIYIWKISLNMFKDNYLTGVGYGRFGYEFLNYQLEFLSQSENINYIHKATNIGSPHNQFLYHFIEVGIFGGLLYLVFYFIIIYNLSKIIKNKKNTRPYLYLLCFFLFLIFHSMVDTILSVILLKLIFYIGLSFVPSKSYVFTINSTKSIFIKCLIIFVSFSFILFILQKMITEYPGYKYWAQGNFYLKNANYSKAIIKYSNGLKHLPDYPSLKIHLARSLIGDNKNKQGINIIKNEKTYYHSRDSYLALSLGELKIGNLDKAENYAKKARSMFPDQLRSLILLSEIYYLKGDNIKSMNNLEQVISESTHVKSIITKDLSKRSSKIYENLFHENIKVRNDLMQSIFSIQSYIDSIIIAH